MPTALGFRMPFEGAKHDRIWMGWPERKDNWRVDKATGNQPAQVAFVQVATSISRFTPVTICANKGQVRFLSVFSTDLLPILLIIVSKLCCH